MEDFNTGFTNKSYFHIIKSIVEGIYERNFDIRKFDFNFRDDSSINACADYDKQGNYDILKINTGTKQWNGWNRSEDSAALFL